MRGCIVRTLADSSSLSSLRNVSLLGGGADGDDAVAEGDEVDGAAVADGEGIDDLDEAGGAARSGGLRPHQRRPAMETAMMMTTRPRRQRREIGLATAEAEAGAAVAAAVAAGVTSAAMVVTPAWMLGEVVGEGVPGAASEMKMMARRSTPPRTPIQRTRRRFAPSFN